MSFASVASRHFSGVGPPSDEAVVILHALCSVQVIVPKALLRCVAQRGSTPWAVSFHLHQPQEPGCRGLLLPHGFAGP